MKSAVESGPRGSAACSITPHFDMDTVDENPTHGLGPE